MKLVRRYAVAAILAIVSLTFLTSLGAAQSLTVSCASPIAEQGVAYSSALVASGGVSPYTFSLATGKLDAGLTLDPSSGDITGTPSKVFVYNYKAKAVDSAGSVATATCRLQVYVHVSIDCPKLNTGAVGEPYSVLLPVYGGVAPFTYTIIAGALPPGLMLNSSTGLISGTPTTGGNFFYTAQVTDSLGAFFDLKCEIKIVAPISLACAGGSGQVGVAYSSGLVVKGGVAPYTFSIIGGSLPPGLVLNPSTGAITGTPTTYGAFNFTAQVVDSTGSAAGTAAANCVITIAPPAISLICPSNTAQAGVAYSSSLVATGGAPPYTFSITNGSLPPGLVLNPSTGAITGTPTTGGTFNFTAQVVDSTGTAAGTAAASCSIVVAAPVPALVCPTSIGTVGVAYSSALVATSGLPPYTFSITSGSLPAGLTLNPSTGAITGTPTMAGTFNFTAQVVDSRGTAAGTTTSSCSILIAPAAPALTCPTATGQVGVAYSSALLASGGAPPYTFSITSGSLPTGLTLNPSTGAITGTPTAYGTFNFTAQVVDSRGTAAGTTTSNCSIVIAPPQITLTCPAATTGTVGVAYSSSLTAGGGVPPYTYSITSGSLPAGLMLNSSTGAITGTPTTAGTFNFTAQVVDSTGTAAGTTTSNCSIVIAPAPPTLTCPASTGQVGAVYSSALVAAGGVAPYTFSITSGSLPAGLILNPSTGAITGTPTTAGTFNFTAQVVDSRGTAAGTSTSNCSIVIAPAPPTLTCPASTGQVGVAYSSALVAAGGVSPYTFSITSGSLPGGLTLNPSTGAITGTPTAYGTFSFTAQVVDSRGTAAGTSTSNCSIVIAPPQITLTCPPSTTGTVGVAYNSSLSAGGGVPPYTYSITAGSLPAGLTLNSTTGAITGTPTTAGTFNFTAQVVDSTGTAAGTTTSNCSIVIAPAPPTLTCPTATGQVGAAYSSALVAAGGVSPYTFSITAGSLPAGLTLNSTTGAITGTPTTAGPFNFTAQVVDSRGTAAGTTTSNCSIVIAPAPPTLTCPTATGQVGAAYSSALVAAGGVSPYTFSITAGSLPAGLTLNSTTGAITGTPTTAGPFNFTAQVVDSRGTAAGTTTSNCSIVIAPAPPTLTCPTATGQVGVAYTSALVAAGGVAPYTFSITAGSLPSGLTLNSTTGAITGTPTTAGTFNFSAQVVDSRGTAAGTTTSNCSIVIAPAPPTLTCPTATGQVGTAYTSALGAAGGVPPYTFSITSGSLPDGLTLNTSTGAITGTPTTAGTFNFTAQVVDSRGTAAGTTTSSCSIVIAPAPPTLTCPTATGTVGTAYSSALVAAGGVSPYTFSITAGSLPAGLTLNSSTGAITGTPTTAGTFNFTAQVVDSRGTAAGTTTSTCSIVIAPAPPTLTCPTATGTVGTAYSSALVAAGGVSPYTFSITAGSLPAGLTLNSSTGAITGTPTTAGTFNFTAQVVDSRGTAAGTTTSTCSIVIAPAPPTLTCPTATGTVGTAYSSALVAAGGVSPYTFSITAGSLPAGLTLNSSTGAITGTPTTAGTFNFTAQVVDSRGTAAGTTTSTCSIVIAPAPPTLTCPTATGTVGTAYSSALVAAGGVSPYTFSITAGSLPAGLTLNSTTGAITGTPTTAGTFNFTAQVVDSRGTAAGTTTSTCSIVIAPAPPTLTCPTATGTVGTAYSSALVAAGGVSPYTFSITAGSLPAGLTLNSTTGAITGTPTTAGTFNFTAQVVDSRNTAAGTTTSNCSIVIAPAPPTLTCPTATGTVGTAYSSALVAAGGVSPYTFSITAGSLPAGLTLNSTTGAITGTPTTAGTFNFTAQVVDSRNTAAGTTTSTCSIVIAPAPPTLTCPTATGTVGTAYSSALVAAGGVSPYTFSITAGSLPAGLTLNSTTGAITGTPTTAGTFNFTAQVVDSRGTAAGTTTSTCSIVIAPAPPTLTCPTATGTVGTAYSSALVAAGGVSPYTFSITAGSLPAGLTLNSTTGAITGTPTTAGTFNFTAQVVDSRNTAAGTTTSNCSIVIAPAPPTLTCPTATGTVGTAYSSALVAAGGVSPYTFSITAGSLPAGLTLNSTTGAITGTPTTAGTFNFTAQVVDSRNTAAGTTTSTCSIVIAPAPPTLTCPTATGTVGTAYSSALVAAGGVSPYTFSITAGSLPAGLTLNSSTGAITGTPTTAGTFNFTAQVVDSRGTAAGTTTSTCSIVIAPAPPTLTCPTATGQVGVAYTSALVAAGGVSPYTFSIIAGSLPAGLTLNSTTGAITGTPTTTGTFNFTGQVVDSRNNAAGTTTSSCSIVIGAAPPTLACVTPTGPTGATYNSALVVTGGVGPYTYSITAGSLPPGLTLNTSTGAITGTPTTLGAFNFTAQVVDSRGNSAGTGTTNCSVTVVLPPVVVTCPTATGQVGVAYSSALSATGGAPPYTFSITAGSLPAGLTLNSTTGAITGTPTTAGTFNFTAQAVDTTGKAAGTGTTSCSIVIAPPPIKLACATSTGQVGVAYSSALTASGGAPPYTFSISSGSLPAGLALNTSTGAITGTPTTSGTFNFTAQVVDSRNNAAGTTTASCGIVVAPAPPALACPTGTGQVGVAYSSALVASGGVAPYTFSISSGSLPAGLTLNTSTGAITGTPTSAGTFNFTAQVVDSRGTAAGTTTSSCSIVISPPNLTLTCPTNTGTVGLAYSSAAVATGGIAPYTFTIASGSLPPGLTLNSSTGAITGTPSSEGTFSFSIKVTDHDGYSLTVSCAIVIKTCGTSLMPITYGVSEGTSNAGQIIWFNSHLNPLGGTIPSSTFRIYITNGKIAFGSSTLTVPDAVITFSSSATCAQTSFNTTLQRWETTIPLSQASNSGIFAAGLAYLIPSGFQGVSSITWTADISSTAPGLSVTWQIGASNWLASYQSYKFPTLSTSPFVPDYNGMEINPAQGITDCSFNGSADHTGSPEFSSRSYLLVSGGCGQGSGNWTGTFSCAPQCVQVCTPGTPACLALPVNNAIQSNANFAGIGLDGVQFDVQGPITITGDLAVGSSGSFQLTNNAWLNSTLFADPTASVSVASGSGLAGGEVTQSFSAAQTAATTLSSWAAGLTATQTISSIQSSTTITGNGGQNVINVGYILMTSGGTITIKGGALDSFIINVQSGMVLGGGASIVLSGVQPAEVLFNFPGGTGLGLGSSTTAGIFLSPNNEIYISQGNHNSEFISGVKLVLDCNNTTITAPACGVNGTPIVPYMQVNNGSWQESNNGSVSVGTCVNLGPQPSSGGSWSWTGPNGYTSTSRQINSIPLSKGTNVYVAIYTDSHGMQSTETFTITAN